jgi:WhiB family redox-sensing transcriptional regulator
MKDDDGDRLAEIAEVLGRLNWIPRDLLADVVRRYGLSVWLWNEDEQPELTGDEEVDRELAARLCANCPVQAECLELELRLHGADTAGVWGGLSEQDRRALYPLWREHGGCDEPDEYREGDDGP